MFPRVPTTNGITLPLTSQIFLISLAASSYLLNFSSWLCSTPASCGMEKSTILHICCLASADLVFLLWSPYSLSRKIPQNFTILDTFSVLFIPPFYVFKSFGSTEIPVDSFPQAIMSASCCTLFVPVYCILK